MRFIYIPMGANSSIKRGPRLFSRCEASSGLTPWSFSHQRGISLCRNTKGEIVTKTYCKL